MNNEETSKEKPCNHFMVWNIQGGYSYYRCDKCNYIDGEKTFAEFKKELLEKIEKLISEKGQSWDSANGLGPDVILVDDLEDIKKQFNIKKI